MLYGIIDIGTNTIRGVVYEQKANGIQKVEDKLVRSHILRETTDKKLTESGINRLIVVLNKLSYVMKKCGCEQIKCFATSAMRDIENADEVVEFVRLATGIYIEIISEKEEAEYDFYAMRNFVTEHSAIGFDLGGGSCQIVQFEYDRLLLKESFKIGVNRINRQFVRRNVPDYQEEKQMEKYLENVLYDVENLFGARYAYAMGGTARAALKISDILIKNEEKTEFLSVRNIEKIINITHQSPQKMFEFYYEIVKARAETIVSGLIILKKICEQLNIEGFYVLPCSVRDGYLDKMIKSK